MFFSLLVFGCWLLFVDGCCWLIVVGRCLLVVVCCSLLVDVRCVLFVFVVIRVLFVTCRLWFVGLMFVVSLACCSLCSHTIMFVL